MVSVRENRARVDLQPLTPLTPGPSEGWHVCRVMVDAADPVEGYTNLLGSELPREFEALIPAAVAEDLGSAPRWHVEASFVAPGRLRVEKIAP